MIYLSLSALKYAANICEELPKYRVGIAVQNLSTADELINIILKNSKNTIGRVFKSRLDKRIEFNNGSTISIIYASTNARGHAFNQLIVDSIIEKEIINTVLRPCEKCDYYKRQTKPIKIICISGKARHGKDTLASMMKKELEKTNKRVLITHYADLLKYICKNFFNWDEKKDEKGRQLLQYIGTDVVRNKDENYWVKFVSDMLSISEDRWDYVLIPDTRFLNEINYLKERGYDVFTIRIVRDGFENNLGETNQAHESETALDNYKFDKIIKNNLIKDLKEEVLRTINKMEESV